MNLQQESPSRHAQGGQSVTAQEFVERWLRAHANEPGFRESTAVTPRGEIPQLEVSSWLQLPDILQKVSTGPVRVVFPTSEDSRLTSEQAAIKDFLRKNHRAPMEALLPSLTEKIKNSLTILSPGLISSTDAWISFHARSMATSRSLVTTDLINAPTEVGHEQLTGFKRVAGDAFTEHVASGRPLVVTIPAAVDPKVISGALREVCEANPAFASAKASAIIWTPSITATGSQLEELSLDGFLARYPSTSEVLADATVPKEDSRLGAQGKVPENEAIISLMLAGEELGPAVSREPILSQASLPPIEGEPNQALLVLDRKLSECLDKHTSSGQDQTVTVQRGAPKEVAKYLEQICKDKPEIAAAQESLFIEVKNPVVQPLSLKDFLAKYLPSRASSSNGAASTVDSSIPATDSRLEGVANDPGPSSTKPQGTAAAPDPALPLDSTGPVAGSQSSSSNEAAVAGPATGSVGAEAVAQTSERDAAPSSDAPLTADQYALGVLEGSKLILQNHFGQPRLQEEFGGSHFVESVQKCFEQAKYPSPFSKWMAKHSTKLSIPGKSEELEIKKGRAHEILKECMGRSLDESTQRLVQSLTKLLQMRDPAETTGSHLGFQQTDDLVILPNHGSAIFMSDLEGGVENVAMLIDYYQLLERWENKEPIFLCILGDSIDRTDTGSLLMDFLLELKVHRGFSENVIILPGNHEICVELNYDEIEYADAPFLGDLFRREYMPNENPSAYPSVRAQLEKLCPEAALSLQSRLSDIHRSRYQERWGLYTLFHSVFQALPRSIVSRNGLYAAHAGFPMHGPFKVLFEQAPIANGDTTDWFKKLADIRVPEAQTQAAYKAMREAGYEMIWNDLTTDFGAVGQFVDLDDNRRKAEPCRPKFTLDDFARFGKATGTSLMIRGHQHNPKPRENLPGPVMQFLSSLGRDPRCPKAWIAGNIATVEHSGWGTMLDLSIKGPTVDDIVWIGQGSSQGSDTLNLHWPPLP